VVQSFVIEHGGKVIVVDTCVGNNKDWMPSRSARTLARTVVASWSIAARRPVWASMPSRPRR